ncbi:MAG: FUN14 domain-containing protein [Candidatus Bathyarchaeia archaeon]
MSEISPIIYEVGLGGIIGFITGFFIKKLGKLILFLIGVFTAVLVYLGLKGVLSVNYEELFKLISDSLGLAGSAFSWLIHVIVLLPFVASFAMGFLVGFKLG